LQEVIIDILFFIRVIFLFRSRTQRLLLDIWELKVLLLRNTVVLDDLLVDNLVVGHFDVVLEHLRTSLSGVFLRTLTHSFFNLNFFLFL